MLHRGGWFQERQVGGIREAGIRCNDADAPPGKAGAHDIAQRLIERHKFLFITKARAVWRV